jgi:hypothetical protein
MIDKIYIVTLYSYEEDMGAFYFSTQEKADKFVADMSSSVDGDFHIDKGNVDVPYVIPDSVWFCVDENYRVTGADLVEGYDEENDICYVKVLNTNNRHSMEATAIARAEEIMLERGR